MSDDLDDGWYGDADPDNLPQAGAADAPIELAPGVTAGDFANGSGLLGIVGATATTGGSTAPRGK